MLIHPTLDRLESLRLHGMAQALREQLEMSDTSSLTFDERLGLMVDREATTRDNLQLRNRLKRAALRQHASVADIDFRKTRGLSKPVVLALSSGDWIRHHQNILITGATGVGKSYLACALAHAACMQGYSALYFRLPRLLEELQLTRGDGRYLRTLKKIARTDVVLIDDWGLVRMTHQQQTDILEILDDRHKQRSTMITSQIPIDTWHQSMADPTLADAILDRLTHTAHTIILTGDSMRKLTATNIDSGHFRK